MMSEKDLVSQSCGLSREGFGSGKADEDYLLDIENIYQILDESVIPMPSSFADPGNGGLGPSANCFSNYGTVSNLDNMRIDFKGIPCRSTMMTPYFNTMPGNNSGIGAMQNSSLMSRFSPNFSASSEPYVYPKLNASQSEAFLRYQFFPRKEEFVNNMESGFRECQSGEASRMVFDRHVGQDNGTSERNYGLYASSERELVSSALVKPYNSFQENRAVPVKVKPAPELENTVYSSVPGNRTIYSDVHAVQGTPLQWSGVSNCAISYQTDVWKEYSLMAPPTSFPGQVIDGNSFYNSFHSDDCLQNVAEPDPVNSHTEYLDNLVGDEDHDNIRRAGFNLSSFTSGTVESPSKLIPDRDDDSDIHKTESCAELVNLHQYLDVERPVISSEHSKVSQTSKNREGLKFESTEGNIIFPAELQDLSQPMSEANPPDGVLAVSLLRHQRIALAWMSQKETSGNPCFGGILADDQGLGKTISTIALILTERSTSSLPCEEDSNNRGSNQSDQSQMVFNDKKDGEDSLDKMNGRPAAGTLIVCPTSLMRQWADEILKKVTLEAKLSVLVYHGCSRTKDPHELAKYDVVITTYSIVSLEVPELPLDKADDEKKGGIHDGGVESAGVGSNKKDPQNFQKKRKHMDCEPVVFLSGPLADVSWFRVVLDEAQSIKNHKTQAARACSGLYAKRRWCLSGTPIQNSIDDLFSYFRFLKYDPYSSYQTFFGMIKNPISKYPVKGYRRLQAILKNIMLRRTKDTLLDGKPVISLPPKSIELRRVDFTKEERDFYSKLECDSRDQFKEYAEAGTVQQNYCNILLLLLRLRQACDHPLLVSGLSWTSSSDESAENFPWGSSKIKATLDILKSLNQSSENGESNQQLGKSSSIPATPAKSSMDVKVSGEKAIVFTQWTKMLDLVEAGLKSSGIQYRRFDGDMTVAARDAAVQEFNTLPEVSVMIMSLKAASLGLNMVAACHVLMLDLWWNPTTEDQAIDRAHRIGQTRPVKVVRFTVKDTVEDRILALQQKKRMMVASAFGEEEKGNRQTHLSVEDLNYLFMADD